MNASNLPGYYEMSFALAVLLAFSFHLICLTQRIRTYKSSVSKCDKTLSAIDICLIILALLLCVDYFLGLCCLNSKQQLALLPSQIPQAVKGGAIALLTGLISKFTIVDRRHNNRPKKPKE